MDSFSPSKFINDVEKTCKAINAPFSERATRAVLSAFSQSFHDGAVLWRTTNRPGDALNYRFYERQPIDAINIAISKGLLEPNHPLVNLLTSWSAPWGSKRNPINPEQSCDFDAEKGLTKAWAFMGGLRPLDDLLSVKDVPACIIMHSKRFHDLGLQTLRHVAVDFHSNTVNIYFRAPGPITSEQALSFLGLAGHTTLSRSEFAEMQKYLSPMGYTFAVTISVPSGVIERVAFYVLGLDKDVFPEIGHRMSNFFSEAPNYDAELFTAVAWSYGRGGGKYMKAEKSCCGQVVELVRGWKSNLAVDEGVD